MSATAMAVDSDQMRRFRERVERVQKKAGKVELAPLGPVEFDAKGAPIVHRLPSVQEMKARRSMRAVLLSPFVLVLALALGVALVAAARYARLYLDGGALTGADAGAAMLKDASMALAVLLVLRILVNAKGRLSFLGNLGGVAAGVLAMHNLVHVAPEVWTAAFPEAWVSDVLATTQPHTILIRGVSYVL